jgi:hypothetical protein
MGQENKDNLALPIDPLSVFIKDLGNLEFFF